MRTLLPVPAEAAFLGIAVLLLSAWLLAALSFRRMQHARLDPAFLVFAIMPLLQLPLIVVLSIVPGREKPDASSEQPAKQGAITRPAVMGALAGMAICVVAAVFGTLVLRNYGVALFMATPFIVGMTSAYVANRKRDIGISATMNVVWAALGLGGAVIVGVAIEGVICLVMASVIAIPIGLLGGASGYYATKRLSNRTTLSGLAVLPLLFLVEAAIPPRPGFVSIESVEVSASPQQVWNSITHMGTISDPPAPPFGWGLAYPIAGEIDGEGVGALRKGIFSTGIAYERVTVWEQGRELTFDVLSDPPALKELSPYDHVHAPHLAGYFSTSYAKFTITPLENGRTRLSLETGHTLDLAPAVYWTPIAEWAVRENKQRVLRHFARQAERDQFPRP